MAIGVLSDPSVPFNVLLDAIRYAETGHLSPAASLTARSDAGAVGPYQFLEKNLHDMGYGMPRNIPMASVQDPFISRDLAGQYVQGFTDHHNFKSPLEQLVAYTIGPQAASEWVARGSNLDELGPRTQNYILRAANYITENNQPVEETQMANTTFMGMGFQDRAAQDLARMAANGNPMADYLMQFVNMPPGPLSSVAGQNMSSTPGIISREEEQAYVDNLDREIMSGIMNNIGIGQANASTPTTNSGVNYIPIYPQGTYYIPEEQASGPDNRRDQSQLAMRAPRRNTGNGNLLIKMGSAGLRGAQTSGLESMAAIGDAYSDEMDLRRSNALEAYKASLKAAGKQRPKGNPVSPYNAVVLDTLNDIIPSLEGDTSWWSKEAGVFGSLLRNVPGTKARDFEAKLDTLKANIGFDRLQKMRDESPTGGALGQVSEMELRQLNAALGSLDQSQSPEQLRENLLRIRDHYIRAVSALEAEYAAAGIDISSKIQPMGGGSTGSNMGVGQTTTINGVTIKRIK